ncbi:methionine--tRNA ligase [Candidatus Karelsulcia muelleri]|uniref:Methionine--tRNA ligase n=1 Tax=Candidatus Karelsulcia muelleri PSPU TaxID=1189303 RepID=A0AAD1AXS0_9FLAO|nr:methionine--tRNA ligase [Candidatus Karelsulcia muelleri]NJJ98813.1 methionine--tRNA ligase [Candidatus Karelsulcia muelleri]BAO66213.1 methionyl-tRNA synthetase [Candidatus Karelsulcia muelleri PSPU]
MKNKNIYKKRYTVTAALPYANGPIHIGHLSGVYLPADIFVRYLKYNGKKVIFISGTDEHGVPITIKAKEEGLTKKKIVDKYHILIKKSLKKIGILFDNFSRTTSKIHYKTSISFFKKLYKKKKILERETEHYYDNKVNKFLPDRYILGICPKCNYNIAYGDQCEKCGFSISPEELIKPYSYFTGVKPILKKTKHWYLPLNKYQNFLEKCIKNKKKIKKNVYGQIKSLLNEGLKTRAITRDLNWGIPIPIPNNIGKVLYVWFEAPIGYISSTIEWSLKKGKKWEKYWKYTNTAIINFIGKDNIIFHCIIFPIMLKIHGNYILPDNVPANEFLNIENKKISTSKKWAVWLHEYLEDFPNKEDVLRYVLISNMPETKDTNFSWKDFKQKNNSELVSILGNFVNRVVVLTKRYFNGKVPYSDKLYKKDLYILDNIKKSTLKIGFFIEKYNFKYALIKFMNLARLGNKYLTLEEPWKKFKLNKKRVKTIIYISLQIIGALGYLSNPFLPFTSKKILKMLNLKKKKWNFILKSNEIVKPGLKLLEFNFLFKKIKKLIKNYE